ncbi:MAG: hypothetical protein E7623_05410 [Ruminococcaceae bacterium]|nr:hypothetical protein [Oscillospiraceae bacterium]
MNKLFDVVKELEKVLDIESTVSEIGGAFKELISETPKTDRSNEVSLSSMVNENVSEDKRIEADKEEQAPEVKEVDENASEKDFLSSEGGYSVIRDGCNKECLRIDKSDIRQGIILSEILGPPVSRRRYSFKNRGR